MKQVFVAVICVSLMVAETSFAQTLLLPVVQSRIIESPNSSAADFFGQQIVLTGDGTTVVVSARDDDLFASSGGALHLFNTDGEFQRTIGSPNAQERGEFGSYLTAVGENRILAGGNSEDESTGNVYLFNTLDGSLLKTFNAPKPAPGAQFGGRFLLASDEYIYIASWFDQSVEGSVGVVYKYDLNGDLISQLVNPNSDLDINSCFGRAGVLVGDEGILIGDACEDVDGVPFAGAAYFFNFEDELMERFPNPAPAELDVFGSSVAYAGGRVLIGGPQIDDDSTGRSSGAAYIFETDGALVSRVHDPHPSTGNWFAWNAGSYKASNEQELFIVGSIFDGKGRAYLYDRDGRLFQQINAPDGGQRFGKSFAQVGEDLLIGQTEANVAFPNGRGVVWGFEPAHLGDYNLDGEVDLSDLNSLCTGLASGEITQPLDITGDDLVSREDLTKFLELTGRLSGDADFSGQVTFGDFLALSSNFGEADKAAWSIGDFDCSGRVEFADFLLLSSNFGKVAEPNSVPEPSVSGWFAILVFAGLSTLRVHGT